MNISCRNVTIRLTENAPVTEHAPAALSNINLTLEAGQVTLLVGQTGAGKSTLLRTLSGLVRPVAGEIHVGDIPLFSGKKVNRQAINPTMMLFQSAERQFFKSTLEDEFQYSLRRFHLSSRQIEERMNTALRAMNLDVSLRTVNPRELSGGQQRRAAMATTIAALPLWYLLDEPSAGLDGESLTSLKEFVVKAARDEQRGFLISTHDLDAWLPVAHRVVILESGKVRWEGTPRELCEHPDVLLGAGVGLPTFTALALDFQAAGWSIPSACMDAEETALAILHQMKGGRLPLMHSSSQVKEHSPAKLAGPLPECDLARECLDHNLGFDPALAHSCNITADGATNAIVNAAADRAAVRKHPKSGLHLLDARAKWLCYIALSITLLGVPAISLIPASVLVAGLYRALRIGLQSAWRVARVFLVLLASAVLFAGVGWNNLQVGHVDTSAIGTFLSHFTWSWHRAMATFVSLFRVLLVLLLSSIFTETTSTIAMKTSLEGTLRPLSRIGFPFEAFAFGTSLVLRFVPLLTAEAGRFSEIAQVRGKKVRKPGRIALSDAGTFMLPLIFSLFHLGEELAFAMEARGLTHFGQMSRKRKMPSFTKREWSCIIGTTLLILILWFL